MLISVEAITIICKPPVQSASPCLPLPPVLATPSSAGTASDGLVARSKIRDLQPQLIQLPLTVDINMHTRRSLRAWPDVLEFEGHAEGIEAIEIFQNHSR